MLLSSSIFSGLKRHLNVKTTGEEAACCLRAYVGKRQIRRCLSSSHVRKGGKAETICSPSNEGGKDPTDFIKCFNSYKQMRQSIDGDTNHFLSSLPAQ